MNDLLLLVAIALYLGAWGVLVWTYARAAPANANAAVPKHNTGIALALSVLALLCHGSVLSRTITTPNGLDLGFFNAASVTTWVIAALLTVLAVTKPIAALGLIIWPLSALALIGATLFHAERLLTPDASAGVQAHVVTSVLAASVLTIAACQSFVLYLQERRLRARRPGRMTRVLPPLQLQEALLVQMLGAGFFLLSLSLASGVAFVQNLLGQHLLHKTVLACTAWAVFATVLYGHWRYGWRGRTLIRWSLGGFTVLMLAYFGAKLVLEVVLGRSWSA